MSTRSILDDVFSMDEETSESFMEAIRKDYDTSEENGIGFDSVEVYKVSAPPLKTINSGFIRLMCGPISNSEGGWSDYVWHIAPNHPKKPWKVRPEHLLLAIQKSFLTVIPQTTRVWIWSPDPQWEVLEWTFKAMKVLEEWSVTIEDIEEMNIKLLEVCNSLV